MTKSSLNPRPGEWELADLCLYNDLNHVVLIEQRWFVKSGGRKARNQLFFFSSEGKVTLCSGDRKQKCLKQYGDDIAQPDDTKQTVGAWTQPQTFQHSPTTEQRLSLHFGLFTEES